MVVAAVCELSESGLAGAGKWPRRRLQAAREWGQPVGEKEGGALIAEEAGAVVCSQPGELWDSCGPLCVMMW